MKEIDTGNNIKQVQLKWLPWLIGIVLTVLVLLLWTLLERLEFSKQKRRVDRMAVQLISKITADFDSRMLALRRIVKRWEVRGGTPKTEFLMDGQAYIDDFPGLMLVAWINRAGVVKWRIPIGEDETSGRCDFIPKENCLQVLERARISRKMSVADPIELPENRNGLLLYFPIFFKNDFDGVLIAVLRSDHWIDFIRGGEGLPGESQLYQIQLSVGGKAFYSSEGWTGKQFGPFEESLSRKLGNHPVRLNCRPGKAFFDRYDNLMNEVIMLIGLFFSFLIAYIVHLFQKSRVEIWKTQASNLSLENAIKENLRTRDELIRTNARLDLATRAGHIGVWVWNMASDELLWNDQMYELYDLPNDFNPTYSTWKNMLLPDDLNETEVLLQKALEGKARFNTEFRIQLSNGAIRHIQTAASIEWDEHGEPIRMTGVNWDITENKIAEETIALERRRLADILEGTHVGTWEWHVPSGDTIFNQRWAEIIGYTLDEISPTTIDTWKKSAHPEDLKISDMLLQKHFNGALDYFELEARMRHKNGDWIWVLDRGKVATWARDGKPLIMSGTRQDITDRKRYEERIRHLATHDPLTDLPSLRMARDRIVMAVRMARRNNNAAAVLFLDLDGFKTVNDTLGHEAGDKLLIEIANRLKSCIRETDTVSRIGGDEFLIILTDLQSRTGVSRIAEHVITSISKPVTISSNQVAVGVSIGIACFPEDGDGVEELINKSDKAMYRIKKSGKNGFTFYSN